MIKIAESSSSQAGISKNKVFYMEIIPQHPNNPNDRHNPINPTQNNNKAIIFCIPFDFPFYNYPSRDIFLVYNLCLLVCFYCITLA